MKFFLLLKVKRKICRPASNKTPSLNNIWSQMFHFLPCRAQVGRTSSKVGRMSVSRTSILTLLVRSNLIDDIIDFPSSSIFAAFQRPSIEILYRKRILLQFWDFLGANLENVYAFFFLEGKIFVDVPARVGVLSDFSRLKIPFYSS